MGKEGCAVDEGQPSRESEEVFSGDDGRKSEASKPHQPKQKDGGGPSVSNTNGSDEDPAAVDERRQKRMLSNRESARRSRLRKQQHLDEMRGQVAVLRSENTEMMNKYNIATRHYSQLTDENRALRNHAMELSRRLQRLYHQAAAQGHPVSHDLMMSPSHLEHQPIPRLW